MGTIKPVRDILEMEMDGLLRESLDQGYRFIPRLIEQWETGENTFSGPNELFLSYTEKGELVGIGGINEEPYLRDPVYGRLRHVYVLSEHRRRGIGRRIVTALIRFARDHYQFVTLRTPDDNASEFYLSLGFIRCHNLDTVSHIMRL